MGCEGSPDYSKWVSSDYFKKMQVWLTNVNLGKPPSDKEESRAWFRIKWTEEGVRAEASAFQDFKDSEIKGLVDIPMSHLFLIADNPAEVLLSNTSSLPCL